MSAVDVIAEAIHRSDCGCTDWHPKDPEDRMYDQYAAAAVEAVRSMSVEDLADLTKGRVVVDATALAMDELVDAVAEAWYRREQSPFDPVTEWGDLSAIGQWRWRQSACTTLAALAAVLTERAS